ncbi:MAG: hypothetical protein ACM3SY_16250 [Candidatus Omnitrophota bacterium]
MFAKNALLKEIEELLVIPEAREILFHKVQELKNMHASSLKRYKTLIGLIENRQDNGVKHFELYRDTSKPARPGHEGWTASTNLPPAVIDFIVSYDAPPGTKIMVRGKEFENIGKLELVFEKEKNIISGTIRGPLPLSPLKSKEADNSLPETLSETEIMKLFAFFYLNHPNYRKHIEEELLKIWKPLFLDNQ